MEGPGPMGFPDYPGGPQRRLGGFAGFVLLEYRQCVFAQFFLSIFRGFVHQCRGNQQAVITSTTVEVVVPRFVVPAIYGEEGGCLRQIREVYI